MYEMKKKLKNHIKNDGNDQNANIDETSSIKKFWNRFIFTIIPILVAIGAYSSDSLFIRIFSSDYKFSVVRTTMLGGTVNTGFFRAYSTALGELIAPIQILMYVNIRNDSTNPQSIEGIKLEFEDKSDNETWYPIKILSRGNGIYFLTSHSLKDATELDFQNVDLLENLGKGKLLPRDVISGWLFLEFPEKFRKKNMLISNIRLTIYSGFGEKELHIITPVDLDNNSAQTRFASLKPTSIKRDLSNLKIMSETDLLNYFDQERRLKHK